MPQDAQGLATFPGVRQVTEARITLSHGITPGQAEISFAPQPTFPAKVGPLVFTFAGLTLVFPDCAVSIHSIQRNSSGLIWRCQLADRRWKWNSGSGPNGPLFGSYNVRLPDDSIDPERKATPQQLAIICLNALGETNYDVSAMPNFTYPQVNWAGEYPAQALQQICDQEGCRIVLRLDNTIQIAKTGFGAPLPDPVLFGAMENSLSITPPQRPDALMVVGGPSRFQCDFALEAVGLDTDGTVRLIKDLSYKPAGGWTRESPPDFLNVSKTPAINGQIPRELAKQTVWRWYRLEVDTIAGGVQVPGYGTVTKLRQLLPLDDEQVAVYVNLDQKIQNLPAWVFGSYFDGQELFTNTPANTPVRKPFTVDREHGIIKFSDCIWRFDADDADGSKTHVDASMKVRLAVSVRDINTWALHRFKWALVYPGGQWGTGPRVLRHDELVYMTIPVYGYDLPEVAFEFANPPQAVFAGEQPPPLGHSDQFFSSYLQPEAQEPAQFEVVPRPPGVNQLFSNAAAIIAEANYYLAAADLEYQTPAPQEITYAGLLPISPDGAIQQVTWQVSSSQGATTRASRNNEFDLRVPPYRERRLFEEIRGGQIGQLKKLAAKLGDQPPAKFNLQYPGLWV